MTKRTKKKITKLDIYPSHDTVPSSEESQEDDLSEDDEFLDERNLCSPWDPDGDGTIPLNIVGSDEIGVLPIVLDNDDN